MKVGDTIEVKAFCFTCPQGGTGLSNWEYNERFIGKAIIKITKVWYDYETGNNGWGEAVNDELKEYIERNAMQTDRTEDFGDGPFTIPAKTIFWNQFDIIKK